MPWTISDGLFWDTLETHTKTLCFGCDCPKRFEFFDYVTCSHRWLMCFYFISVSLCVPTSTSLTCQITEPIYRHLYVTHLNLIVNWLCCSCKMPKIQAAKPKRQLRWIFHSFGSVRTIINNRLQLFTARRMPDKFLAQWYERDIDNTVGISEWPIDGDIFLFLYLNVCAFICCSLYSPPCHQMSPTLTVPIDDINNAEHINGAPTINS